MRRLMFSCWLMFCVISKVHADEQSARILAQVQNNVDVLQTSMSTYMLHFRYNAKYITYYEPLKISDSRTTALVHSRNVFVTDPESHARAPMEKVTSYSQKLNMAFEAKTLSIEAFFADNGSKVIQENSPGSTLVPGSFPPAGNGLTLVFDGEKSRALMKRKNTRSGEVQYTGMETPGDAISLYVFSPIHCYSIAVNSSSSVEFRDGEVIITRPTRVYTLLPDTNLALGSYLQEYNGREIKTTYLDFKLIDNGTFPLPMKIVQEERDTRGVILTKRIVEFQELEFASAPPNLDEIFRLEFPPGTDFDNNAHLDRFLMRH